MLKIGNAGSCWHSAPIAFSCRCAKCRVKYMTRLSPLLPAWQRRNLQWESFSCQHSEPQGQRLAFQQAGREQRTPQSYRGFLCRAPHLTSTQSSSWWTRCGFCVEFWDRDSYQNEKPSTVFTNAKNVCGKCHNSLSWSGERQMDLSVASITTIHT